MERFNSNESTPEREYDMYISLTETEMEHLVAYVKGKNIDITYIIENILDDVNPEIYGIKYK